MYECMFDIDGNILRPAKAVSVKCIGEMLVIEFINNLILPLRVVKSLDGGWDCCLLSSTVFRIYPDRPGFNVILVSVEHISAVGAMEFCITVGDGQSSWLEDHEGAVRRDGSIYLDGIIYDDKLVHSWMRHYGVVGKLGGMYSDSEKFESVAGCVFEDNDWHYLVKFPNGMSFPVFRTAGGVVICGEHIKRLFPYLMMLSVTVYEIHSGYVRFRCVYYEPNTMEVLDNIELTPDYIKYGDNCISTRLLTKQLVMGVVDEYGSL